MRVCGPLVMLLLSWPAAAGAQTAQPACASAAQCAELARQAISHDQYEDAHTLAWRAMQHSARSDPAVMYLLARAQSLSGRPHDALVMLQRLAKSGFRAPDVATLEDFRRVREFAGWPAIAAALTGSPAPVTPPVAATAAAPPATPPPAPREPAVSAPPAASAPLAGAAAPAVSAPSAVAPAPPPLAAATRATGELAIPASVIAPIALAHDAVSRRYVIADEGSGTLKIVDETSGNAVDLVSRGWAGAYRTTALTIDARHGDLWVAGVDAAAGSSALHQLQLVSGRRLRTIALPAEAVPSRVVSIALGRDSLFVLDALGGRIYALARGAKTLRLVASNDRFRGATSVTAASDSVLHVAHHGGIVRVDLPARSAVDLTAAADVPLNGFRSIHWSGGDLFGVQEIAGRFEAVHIRLNARGTHATRRDVIESAAAAAASVQRGRFYYVGVTATAGLRLRVTSAGEQN